MFAELKMRRRLHSWLKMEDTFGLVSRSLSTLMATSRDCQKPFQVVPPWLDSIIRSTGSSSMFMPDWQGKAASSMGNEGIC